MQDCLVYLVVNRSTYDDDEKRVAFVLSFMTEKEAALWKEQYIATRIDNEGVLHLPDWKEFEAKLLEDFRHEDQVRGAMARLERIQQGNRNVEEFITEFKLLVGQAGLTTETFTDNVHLIGIFRKALHPQLAERILYGETIPETIGGWYRKAVQYEGNFRMANAYRQVSNRFRNYGNFGGNQNWNNRRSPQRDPNAMDVDTVTIDALTPEERSDLMRKGACFNCRQIGHISQNCPRKRGNSNNNRNDNYGNQNKGANNRNNNNQKKWTAKEAFAHVRAMDAGELEEFADLTLKQGFEEASGETTAKIQDF